MIDVFGQRGDIFAAVLMRVFQAPAQLTAGQSDEHHLAIGRRQMPIRRTGWYMFTVARRQIARAVAGTARQTRNALAPGAALYAHRMHATFIELERCITGNVAILAAGMLQNFLYRREGIDGFCRGIAGGGTRTGHCT
jgi:D-serine deaminase-like pyridoxal phosphate-dependent protein